MFFAANGVALKTRQLEWIPHLKSNGYSAEGLQGAWAVHGHTDGSYAMVLCEDLSLTKTVYDLVGFESMEEAKAKAQELTDNAIVKLVRNWTVSIMEEDYHGRSNRC